MESDLEKLINSTVDGLFSIFATLGTIPIIRCPRNHASEWIAGKLEQKFLDSMRDSRSSLFVSTTSSTSRMVSSRLTSDNGGMNVQSKSAINLFQRPLLILLDRSMDLATPLHHEMTYQSLVHDIFVSYFAFVLIFYLFHINVMCFTF